MEYTTAPWKWDSQPYDYDIEQDAPWLIADNGCRVIKGGEIQCKKEDAQLIAAAPELYEALKLAKDIISGKRKTPDFNNIIHQALNKAEGK